MLPAHCHSGKQPDCCYVTCSPLPNKPPHISTCLKANFCCIGLSHKTVSVSFPSSNMYALCMCVCRIVLCSHNGGTHFTALRHSVSVRIGQAHINVDVCLHIYYLEGPGRWAFTLSPILPQTTSCLISSASFMKLLTAPKCTAYLIGPCEGSPPNDHSH